MYVYSNVLIGVYEREGEGWGGGRIVWGGGRVVWGGGRVSGEEGGLCGNLHYMHMTS